MKPLDSLDYNSAGFDNFLSRSIDDLQQANLDAAGPQSNQLSFDRSQVNGSLGDKIQVGDILIDGKDQAITLSEDGRLKSLLIGRDSQGRQVVKVAKEGFDAKDGRDDELVFNSLQNTLKIVKTDTITVSASGNATNWSTVPHNLGFAPIPLAFLNNVTLSGIAVGANVPLPTYTSLSVDTVNQRVDMRTWLHAMADDTNFYIVAFNSTGTPFNINIRYYLLQESAQ